eukprot:TRINITY_DN23759_c0_g1_i1.p1 TRINITY_DN23759_c0_g1~~TRINITY_DN23759_c0_g1_i1.p1  ORF type:complete len:717 (+),score=92.59 TRINITY_DN23759_c0_g1_i1:1723-3873(+)
MRDLFLRIVVFMLLFTTVAFSTIAQRQTISLNGIWQVEEGRLAQMPESFNHECPVPGFIDMATPEFDRVGDWLDVDFGGMSIPAKDSIREAFWYKRTFKIEGDVPDFAQIKIWKAKYSAKVWLNGKEIGEQPLNFTSGEFDASSALKGNNQENILVVRLESSTEGFGKEVISGLDYEKLKYLPGIYDNVELILSSSPRIVDVQVVPNVDAKVIKAVVTLNNETSKTQKTYLSAIVKTYSDDVLSGSNKLRKIVLPAGESKKVEIDVEIDDCKLWSPETPNLYNLELETVGDKTTTRFGMRKFEVLKGTNTYALNNQQYYLRGTNICFFRFVEDHARGDKVWDEEWVRKVFRQFKHMNWNSVRFTIGFPPEFWYRIADEEGMIIQDEYAIWTFNKRKLGHRKEQLVKEYSAMMADHWNYPSVCIWDAQNESPEKGNEQIKEAVGEVRNLDLSNRPWNLGWSMYNNPNDAWEEHPYLYFGAFKTGQEMGNGGFELEHLNKRDPLTTLSGKFGNPLCLNEYGWLWLTRDGKPTLLTEKGYEVNFPNATADERFEFYAYTLASLTEFWRTQRPAVLHHFCGLGHSYDNCYTSDNFTDLESLNFTPYFEQYLRSAFNPIGVCVFNWSKRFKSMKKSGYNIPVVILNDYSDRHKGRVTLKLVRDGKVLLEERTDYKVNASGKQVCYVNMKFPKKAGNCLLIGEVIDPVTKEKIHSVRKVFVR